MTYLLSENQEQELIDYSNAGGALVVSYFTGISNEVDAIKLGGYGGKLVRDHLGVIVDEFAPARKGEPVKLSGGFEASEWSQFASTSSAEVISFFESGVAAGSLAIAKTTESPNWYIGTRLDDASCKKLFLGIIQELALSQDGGDGVEVIRRGGVRFEINHNTIETSWAINE